MQKMNSYYGRTNEREEKQDPLTLTRAALVNRELAIMYVALTGSFKSSSSTPSYQPLTRVYHDYNTNATYSFTKNMKKISLYDVISYNSSISLAKFISCTPEKLFWK
jgi:hypothetical protein